MSALLDEPVTAPLMPTATKIHTLPRLRTLRIGLLGLGNVGQAFVRQLERARGVFNQRGIEPRIDAVLGNLVEHTGAKVILPDAAHTADPDAESGGLSCEDEWRTAGVGAGEIGGPIQRLSDVCPHDFDQGFTKSQDVDRESCRVHCRQFSARGD